MSGEKLPAEKLPDHDHIAAIVPEYSHAGDSTTIITTDGTILSAPVRVSTVLRRLARAQATDLPALKRLSSRATGRSILAPLPLSAGLVLVPLKVRKPKIKGDPCTGYVNSHAAIAVEKTAAAPYRTVVKLSGGGNVATLWHTATVNRRLSLARLLAPGSSQPLVLREAGGPYQIELTALVRRLVEIFGAMIKQYSLTSRQ